VGHELLVGQHHHIGELAIVEAERLEGVDRRDGARGVQELDEEIDVHHGSFLAT
jgi:hypothetical protein